MSGGYCDMHYLPVEGWCVDCKHDFCSACVNLRYRGEVPPDELLCEDCAEKREEHATATAPPRSAPGLPLGEEVS